jgi:agmatine/peptidylarginine deiminase
MKNTILIFASLFTLSAFAQIDSPLPNGFSATEQERIERGDFSIANNQRGIATPPPFDNIRCMAEWEEIQALTIAWTGYPSILKKIVAAAQTETKVIILTEDAAATEDYLTANNAGGAPLSMDNVDLIAAPFNSIWMRDYAANPAYGNEVDDLVLVDWIYNRPTRPDDDASPQYIADHLGLNLYTMTEAPTDVVNTGGNWMSDGFGTAFASKLILEENDATNPYGVTVKSEAEINSIMTDYLGIDRYIKMETLPYDGIHHIDMHMKLIDEETLLVGEYPDGVADGPQINANIEYVISNFNSKWGTPYNVIRIPMPDSPSGLWPSSNPPASYRTYTNAVFVNNTVILPTYRTEYDTTALRIWQESLPGYRIVGIDCDDNNSNIISQSGAIHCITHSVGVVDPLLISHQPLPDTYDTSNPYSVSAYIKHRSGISDAKLYWKTSATGVYSSTSMVLSGSDNWIGSIPAQPVGTVVYYYIEGTSTSGKVQQRPMPAPEGYWSFNVLGASSGVDENLSVAITKVFPNPASAITCIQTDFTNNTEGSVQILDMQGRVVKNIANGPVRSGENKYFFDAGELASGAYIIRISTPQSQHQVPLMVK